MKIKDLDFFNEAVDYSKFINDDVLIIENKEIDLKDLAIKKYKDLTVIIIEKCKVLNQDIDFSIFQKLKTLYCVNNQLTSLPDLSNCSQLEKLSCYNNQLTTLPDLSKCSQLKTLYCLNNQLTSCSSFYKIGVGNVTFLNNPIPQIEVEFVKNVKSINDYYFELFNYCVHKNIYMPDFLKIEWPEDFYDNYILKITTSTQKKYISYLKHKKDLGNLNDDLFSFDLKTNI